MMQALILMGNAKKIIIIILDEDLDILVGDEK